MDPIIGIQRTLKDANPPPSVQESDQPLIDKKRQAINKETEKEKRNKAEKEVLESSYELD